MLMPFIPAGSSVALVQKCISSYRDRMKSSWILVAAALFWVMGALVKIAAADFSSAELVFYRSVFGLVAIYFIILLRTRRWTLALATAHWRAHVYRALAGFAALVISCSCRCCWRSALLPRWRNWP
jgi:hypothetical protein